MKKLTHYFYNHGEMIEHGSGLSFYKANLTCTTFEDLPIKLKEKLAVLMTYPDQGSIERDEGRYGNLYWGYVDGDD